MSIKSILIVGSTGWLGSKITKSILDKRVFNVFLFTRKESIKDTEKQAKLTEFINLGAKTVEGNLEDIPSIKKILSRTNIDTILTTLSGVNIKQPQLNLIQAAKDVKNVKRFIPSEFGTDYDEYIKTHRGTMYDNKKAVVDAIKQSNLEFTLIQTSMFLDMVLSHEFGIDFVNFKAKIPGDGNTKFTSIHTDDVARLVPEILLNPKSVNQHIHLVGDTYTINEALDIFEKVFGRKFERIYIPANELKKQLDNTKPFNKYLFLQHLAVTTPYAAFTVNTNKVDYPNFKPMNVRAYAELLKATIQN